MCASAMKCKQAQYYSLFAGFTRTGLCRCSAGSEWRQGRILFALRLKNVHVVINQMHLPGVYLVLFSHLCLAWNIRVPLPACANMKFWITCTRFQSTHSHSLSTLRICNIYEGVLCTVLRCSSPVVLMFALACYTHNEISHGCSKKY